MSLKSQTRFQKLGKLSNIAEGHGVRPARLQVEGMGQAWGVRSKDPDCYLSMGADSSSFPLGARKNKRDILNNMVLLFSEACASS